MDKNLQSYVRVIPNWLDSDKCKQIVLELESASWEQHMFYDPSSDKNLTRNGDKELDVCFNTIPSNKYIMDRMWEGYFEYIQGLQFNWFTKWNGFTPVRFNRYLKNRVMDEHWDHIQSMFDGEKKGIPTLSCLAVLNDGYKGGEFVMWKDQVIPLKTGDMMIFPSTFLYPHKVNPVSSGVRYSCVSWAY